VAAPPSRGPIRFLLNAELSVTAVELPDGTPLSWSELPRWDPRHFWQRPPYDELEAFGIVREVEVTAPEGGWERGVATLRVEYAGVVADSLHEPDAAYGRSFPTTSGRIVTEGAYLAGSTFWVPWTGESLFPFDLTVDLPAAWRVVSQGEEVSDHVEGDRRRTRWVSAEPMEEIYLIAGPYEVHEVRHGDLRVLAYAYAGTGPDVLEPYLTSTGPVIDRYSEAFGPYPYGKFALVENYWQTGYGMPGFTFLGDRVIRLPFIVDTSYPHEILHNWWGNGVRLRPGEGNWCEGLTTYGADYAAKERESPEAARDYRRSTLQGYRDFAAAGGRDFALFGFRERDSAATQAVGYGKTLMVFHMLRRRVGEEAFGRALRRFYREQRFRRAGWAEIRDAFEAESGGLDLSLFFDEWVRRPGAPVLRLRDVSVEPGGEGAAVRGVIVQAEPLYDLIVPVVVEGGEGRWETEVRADAPETPFEVTVGFAPGRVSLDPDFQIFRMLHEEEVPPALSGILGASATRIVIGSAEEGTRREALLAAANLWATDSTFTVVEEDGGLELDGLAGGTWLLGEGDLVRALRAAGFPGPESEGPGALVAAGRLPAAEEGGAPRPVGLFLPDSAEDVEAIARKIPHYSRWSWLRFEGSRNVGKGLWEPGSSPLTVNLRDR
jgi:hypothetical protein